MNSSADSASELALLRLSRATSASRMEPNGAEPTKGFACGLAWEAVSRVAIAGER